MFRWLQLTYKSTVNLLLAHYNSSASTHGTTDVSMATKWLHLLLTGHGRLEYTQQTQKHLYDICTMSAQRLRRWSDIVQITYKCFSFYCDTVRLFIRLWSVAVHIVLQWEKNSPHPTSNTQHNNIGSLSSTLTQH